ncbi:MaoC/PaaZ C-terminal domain-containing protein [Bacillus spongiae]|uniref:MaoC/PaaZ C-terminal domain-containing protein n=1 Tax=Bacillus spongiae TaxID=2683610 RepID=A0ABU8HHT0_9BACI
MSTFTPITKEPITHTQIVRYAGASGDFNPIHTVVPVAKKAGLPDVIAHGMLVMAVAGEALTTWFPQEKIEAFSVRFQKMTFPGEVLTVKAFVKEEVGNRLTGEIIVVNTEDEKKLSGQFHVLLEEEDKC